MRFLSLILIVPLAAITLPLVLNAEKPVPARAANPRPNIILIMADDLGWKDLNCYGNASLDTPVIDQPARDGMRFTDAYSASPVCTPSRAAIMTGLSPARLRITNHAGGHPPGFALPGSDLRSAEWVRHLSLDHHTIAEHLKAEGYATAFVGKWHLSHRPKKAPRPSEPELRPEHQGFDRNIGGCDFGGPPSYFSPFRNPAIRPNDDEPGYLPDRLASECVSFVREHRDAPFFLCWWNYSVHYPFQAPEALIEEYERRKLDQFPQIRNPTYAAMIEGMDRSIGHLLNAIEEFGLTQNTLVIFTSDNGPFAADVRPLRQEKGHLYEGGIRVPLIVRWPGVVRPATTCRVPVIGTDLFPTIAAAAGSAVNGDSTDGMDLRPLLTGSETFHREAIFFHYPNYAFHQKNRLGSAIRMGEYKLLRFFDDDSTELYHLAEDIGEQHDLAATRPDLARDMNARLGEWLKQSGANLPTRIQDR